MQKAKFRWAIVGTGRMAGKFIAGLRSVQGSEVSLIVSRSEERARAFAKKFDIPRWVGSYEQAANADFDIAYIATPASEHRENALLFISAGKPVLVEKPMATSAADVKVVIEAARAAGVFCMEGMWTRFLPAVQCARTLVEQGKIGEPRNFFGSFAHAEVVDLNNPLFRPELGGGAIYHRAIYPISLALDFLGSAEAVSVATTMASTGVDEEMAAILRHSGGELSTVYAGLRTKSDNSAVLLGTEGVLRFVGPIYRPYGVELESVRPRQYHTEYWTRMALMREGSFAQSLQQRLAGLIRRVHRRQRWTAAYTGNGYAHEARAVMEAINSGQTEHPRCSLEETLAVARLIDELRGLSKSNL